MPYLYDMNENKLLSITENLHNDEDNTDFLREIIEHLKNKEGDNYDYALEQFNNIAGGYASPVGNYFKAGMAPLNLYVEDEFHRATRGGAGGVKSISNYAPVLQAVSRAKGRGFSDVLYLDSSHKKYIEEASSCNIFVVKGNIISTPATEGTILEGITRKSIIDIARDLGYKIEERLIAVDELLAADELFTTGTAVTVATVGSITYKGQRVEYKIGDGLVSQKLYKMLQGIQVGKIEDKYGWVVEIN